MFGEMRNRVSILRVRGLDQLIVGKLFPRLYFLISSTLNMAQMTDDTYYSSMCSFLWYASLLICLLIVYSPYIIGETLLHWPL